MDKAEILENIKIKIQEKILSFENLIAETRASNNDTKSSMGDKYETGREMLQQEINNLQRQLNESLKQQNILQKISIEESHKAQKGALVQTNKGLFYISVSLGEIKIGSTKVMTISEESPLAKAMFGLSVHQNFMINSISQNIEAIW